MGLGEFLAGPPGTQSGHGQYTGHVLVAAVEDGLDLGGLVPAGAGRGDGGHLGKTALCGHSEAVVETFRPLRSRIPEVGLQVPPSRKGAGAAQVAVAPGGVERSIGGRDTGQFVILDEEVYRMAVERVSRQDQGGGAVSGHGRGVERRCKFVVNRSRTGEVRRTSV